MSLSTKELFAMQRTSHPKYAHYVPDGEGRDTYIQKNNGGLCFEPARFVATSTAYEKDPPSVTPVIGYKPAPTLKYISDGSGRDFYVTHSSGGMQAAYLPGSKRSDVQFRSSLRDHSRGSRRVSKMTPQEAQRAARSRSFERGLVSRLTSSNKQWRVMTRHKSVSRPPESTGFRSVQRVMQPCPAPHEEEVLVNTNVGNGIRPATGNAFAKRRIRMTIPGNMATPTKPRSRMAKRREQVSRKLFMDQIDSKDNPYLGKQTGANNNHYGTPTVMTPKKSYQNILSSK